jgi:nicotinate-nucleotide--dimethylbenzimidazole phosphoribosyltransferase
MLDLDRAVAGLPGPDLDARERVARRALETLRPTGALARLDEVAAWVAGWQRTDRPDVEAPACLVFVGDHGVTTRGVSAYPSQVTEAMLGALRAGVATAAVMAGRVGASLQVIDTGVGAPTGDLTVEPALSPERFESCFATGVDAVSELDTDLLVVGEMGIGNTTAAAAICAATFGCTPEDWTGRGTGIDDATFARKIDAVARAAARVEGSGPAEILRHVGGSELTAMAGAIVAARRRSIPVVLDGFVVTAAVAPLELIAPGALDHCVAAHVSSEPGHRLLLDKLAKRPLLDLDLRLGEGSGALLAVPLIALACAAVTDVATFDEWGLERAE